MKARTKRTTLRQVVAARKTVNRHTIKITKSITKSANHKIQKFDKAFTRRFFNPVLKAYMKGLKYEIGKVYEPVANCTRLRKGCKRFVIYGIKPVTNTQIDAYVVAGVWWLNDKNVPVLWSTMVIDSTNKTTKIAEFELSENQKHRAASAKFYKDWELEIELFNNTY